MQFSRGREHKKGNFFQKDLVAAISVAMVAVPQAMAYAAIAGVNLVYGLYAAIIPAFIAALFGSSNHVVYLARRHLRTDKLMENIPGAGVFPRFSLSRQLTAPDAETLSIWDLPSWFHPGENRKPLTYHSDMQRWQKHGDRTELKSVARGQEFVLYCDEYPEAAQWAYNLIRGKNNEC